MSNIIVMALMRHFIGFAGAYLVSKGILSPDVTGQLMELIIGLLMGGTAIGASVMDKKQLVPRGTPIAGRLTETPDANWEPMPEPVKVLHDKLRPPKGFTLSKRSHQILCSVEPKLYDLFETAIINSPHDITVYHGMRSEAEQAEMIKNGASKVARSKHQDGKAVDFFVVGDDGKPDWESTDKYKEVAEHIKDCAARLGIDIVWGGDWRNFKDFVHIELK